MIADPINTCVLLVVRCMLLFSVCQELMGWMKELCPTVSSVLRYMLFSMFNYKSFSTTGSNRCYSNLRSQETPFRRPSVRICTLIYLNQNVSSACVFSKMFFYSKLE